MKLEISSHHLINLIKEDIKLNHLFFGLKDLGIECDPELLGISPIIFEMCGLDQEEDILIIEDYYKAMNESQGLPLQAVFENLSQRAFECWKKLCTSNKQG